MQKNFQEQLIKGKIAELIFQQMWAEVGNYTILPLGYERILPGLLDRHNNDILKPIRTAPDFVLIPKDEKDDNILIVEVKFRKHPENDHGLKELATEQNKRWNPSYLFLASLENFYFGKCDEIIKDGSMHKLKEEYVPMFLQEKYLKMLNEFLNK
jgi:hypothetical protein